MYFEFTIFEFDFEYYNVSKINVFTIILLMGILCILPANTITDS